MFIVILESISNLWPIFGCATYYAKKKDYARTCIACFLAFFFSIFCGGMVEGLKLASDSEAIGSFSEKDEYDREYSAVVYANERPIFCIARISRYKGYTLWGLSLPYNQSLDLFCDFEPKEDITFSINDDYTVHLIRPATKTEYELLENIVVNSSGFFCGDLDTKIFHTEDCGLLKGLDKSRLVYLQSTAEADLFLFEPCPECDPYQYS